MTDKKVNWKTYLITGVSFGVASMVVQSFATYTQCPLANDWKTIGGAGALSSFITAYEIGTGGITGKVKQLIGIE